MPEGLQARPDVPADLGPCSSACGVDQLSQVTPVRVRVPVVNQLSRATQTLVRRTALSNRRPGRLGPVSVGPWGRPSLLGNWGLSPRPRGVDQ